MSVRAKINGWNVLLSDAEFFKKIEEGELKKPSFIFLFDTTGYAAEPFTELGETTLIVDIENKEKYSSNSRATYVADWDILAMENEIVSIATESKFIFGFPPCTDLAVSGALHFWGKAKADPNFQVKALDLFKSVSRIANRANKPWAAENPTSVVSTMWRKPDFSFDPFEFGGYLPENDVHPEYPEYIAARDAYPKRTYLWQGNGFKNPKAKPVERVPGFSKQYKKLGGKSKKTKRIRSSSPRGFFKALAQLYCVVNHGS